MPRKLTGEQVLEMVDIYSSTDLSVREVCSRFGVGQRVLRDILHRRAWTNITDGMDLPSIKKKPKDDYVSRFWSKANKTSTCWLWTGGLTPKGYGQFACKQINESRAHRFAWIICHGEIPDGLHVCHICDIRHCINPDHLFLGTNQDNVDDKVAKNRQYRKAS